MQLIVKKYTFPLVRLVSVQHFGVARVLSKKEAEGEDVSDRQPETHLAEVLVLLHEEICPGKYKFMKMNTRKN